MANFESSVVQHLDWRVHKPKHRAQVLKAYGEIR